MRIVQASKKTIEPLLLENEKDIRTGHLVELLSNSFQRLPNLRKIYVSGSMNERRKIWGVKAVGRKFGLNIRCISGYVTWKSLINMRRDSGAHHSRSRPNGRDQLGFVL